MNTKIIKWELITIKELNKLGEAIIDGDSKEVII